MAGEWSTRKADCRAYGFLGVKPLRRFVLEDFRRRLAVAGSHTDDEICQAVRIFLLPRSTICCPHLQTDVNIPCLKVGPSNFEPLPE